MIRSSLNLAGDEETEGAVEIAFGVRFTDEELGGMVTVGDLHDALVAHIPTRPGKCETSMVFYRLRRALSLMGVSDPVRPDSPIPAAVVDQPRTCLKSLSRLSGLKLPPAELARPGKAALVLCGMAVVLIVIALAYGLPILAFVGVVVIVLAVVCGMSDRGKAPRGIDTVGDLVRLTAPMNYGVLVADGARSNEHLIWAVLTELLGDIADVPSAEIARETRFYPDQKAAA